MEDFVVITGGNKDGSRNQVSEYNVQGWVRDLPQLQQGRHGHGCGHFVNDDSNMVIVIIFYIIILILIRFYTNDIIILGVFGHRWPHRI